jgi:hypothetical protein
MVRAISVGFLGLIFAAGIGCAKSPEEKAKSQADEAIATLNSNASSIDAMGTPRGTWSEGELTKYEGLLNTLEGDITRVESFDGKDGVIIMGSWSLIDMRRKISHNRGILREAHTARARLQSADKHDQLRDLQGQDFAELQKLGDIDSSWPREKLLVYLSLLEKIETRQHGMDELKVQLRMSRTPADFWQHLKVLKNLATDVLKDKPAHQAS